MSHVCPLPHFGSSRTSIVNVSVVGQHSAAQATRTPCRIPRGHVPSKSVFPREGAMAQGTAELSLLQMHLDSISQAYKRHGGFAHTAFVPNQIGPSHKPSLTAWIVTSVRLFTMWIMCVHVCFEIVATLKELAALLAVTGRVCVSGIPTLWP